MKPYMKIFFGMHLSTILLILIVLFRPAGLHCTEFAFITTTDYETGSSTVIWLDGSYTTVIDVADIHSDAVSRYYNGLIYVINRTNGDNIQVLDPSSGFSTLRQFSTGNGSNPKDIAFLHETKAYITRYETNDLWIVNPSNGDFLGSIDLSSLADGDGLCEMDQMFLKGDILFITIQRLDRNNYWLPVGDSYIAVVDCAADTLIDTDPGSEGRQSILLTGTNPFSEIKFNPFSSRLYVSCVGNWGVQDAGVEIINPFNYQTEGYLITESSAGGDINDVEVFSPYKGYAIVTNSSWFTELISFDPSTGSKTATMYSPGGYVINDIEISPYGELFLADQTEIDPGIRIYDTAADTAITANPIYTGLPPFDICFSVPAYAGTEVVPVASLEQNYPNPFNPATTIRFTLPVDAVVGLSIYAVTGHRVKTLLNRQFAAGAYKAVWDGRDDADRPLPSGVYFLRLKAGSRVLTRKALLLR